MAAKGAPSALVVAPQAADGGCGAGYGDPPFALQGGHRERRPKGQRTVTSTRVGPAEYCELSSDGGRPTGGERPEALLEPWPQGQLQRHAGIGNELVQALDVPVLQMVEQLPDVHHFFATCLPVVAEQVIDVPTIIAGGTAGGSADDPLTPSFLRMLQNVDTPAPHGSGGASEGLRGFLPGHVEQTVDIPALRSGVRRLQGFLPEQSATARGGADLHGLLQEAVLEELMDELWLERNRSVVLWQIIVFQQRLSSRSLISPFLVEAFKIHAQDRVLRHPLTLQLTLWMTHFTGFFALFPKTKRSATAPPHSGSELPPHLSPWTPAACDVPMVLEEEEEEEESEDEPDFDVEYVEFDGRWWECEWVPARQQYCWWLAASDGSQAGHTIWRPPWLIGRGPG